MKAVSNFFTVILAIAAWVLLISKPSTDGPEIRPINDSGIKSVAIKNVESDSTIKEDQNKRGAIESKKIATWRKQVDQVPNANKVDGNRRTAIDRDHAKVIARTIESALDGNLEDTIIILKYMGYCDWAERNEQSLNSWINAHEENPQVDLTLQQGVFSSTLDFDWIGDWAAAKERQFRECRATRHLFGGNLRSRLELQAMNGDVLARFMYAMWSPPLFPYNPATLIEWLEYSSLAHQFTMQNINDGEPLGLLAMGLSYLGDKFTVSQRKTGLVLLNAAEQCGVHEAFADVMAVHLVGIDAERARPGSEVIVKEFCR